MKIIECDPKPSGLFIIDTEGEKLHNPDTVPDWNTCPGSLYQLFTSREKALETAKWWGYELNSG